MALPVVALAHPGLVPVAVTESPEGADKVASAVAVHDFESVTVTV